MAKFRIDDRFLAFSFQGFAEQHLAFALTIIGSGIKKVDSEVQRFMHQTDSLLVLHRRPILLIAELPSAKADFRHLLAGRPIPSVLHPLTLLRCLDLNLSDLMPNSRPIGQCVQENIDVTVWRMSLVSYAKDRPGINGRSLALRGMNLRISDSVPECPADSARRSGRTAPARLPRHAAPAGNGGCDPVWRRCAQVP
ncbi:hypothetical protein D3C74_331820 [compost metagenome]